MTSDVGTDLETVSAEDQYLRDYLVLWPHVNLIPLAPSGPTSFDWHHTRSGEEITVYTDQQPRGIGFGHPAAMVLGYYTPSCEPGEPDELRVLLLKRCGDRSPCIHAFPTGSAAVSENVVDAAARGFQDAIGIELSAKARAHLALNHWHLLRETHIDATSWVLWTPSLDVICDICDSDFLACNAWVVMEKRAKLELCRLDDILNNIVAMCVMCVAWNRTETRAGRPGTFGVYLTSGDVDRAYRNLHSCPLDSWKSGLYLVELTRGVGRLRWLLDLALDFGGAANGANFCDVASGATIGWISLIRQAFHGAGIDINAPTEVAAEMAHVREPAASFDLAASGILSYALSTTWMSR